MVYTHTCTTYVAFCVSLWTLWCPTACVLCEDVENTGSASVSESKQIQIMSGLLKAQDNGRYKEYQKELYIKRDKDVQMYEQNMLIV